MMMNYLVKMMSRLMALGTVNISVLLHAPSHSTMVGSATEPLLAPIALHQ